MQFSKMLQFQGSWSAIVSNGFPHAEKLISGQQALLGSDSAGCVHLGTAEINSRILALLVHGRHSCA